MLLANIFHGIGISLSASFVLMIILVIFGAINSNKQSEVEALLEREDKANPMDINEVMNYYLSWISSCKTREQLDQLEKTMKHFITNRFEGKVDAYSLIEARDQIIDAIIKKRFTIGKYFFLNSWIKHNHIPTLSYHLNF